MGWNEKLYEKLETKKSHNTAPLRLATENSYSFNLSVYSIRKCDQSISQLLVFVPVSALVSPRRVPPSAWWTSTRSPTSAPAQTHRPTLPARATRPTVGGRVTHPTVGGSATMHPSPGNPVEYRKENAARMGQTLASIHPASFEHYNIT